MRIYGILILVLLTFGFANAQIREDASAQPVNFSKSVRIFPNPAVDFVHVRIEDLSVEKVKVTLHNIIGNEMIVETEVIDAHEIRIKIRDLVSGYYLIALKDDDDRFRGTYKFLKR
jgi:hypothetical protein